MTTPAQARGSARGGRTYIWPPPGTLKPGDEPEFEVSSVTTLIGKGLPKPALMYWAAKSVAEEAVNNLDFLGSMVSAKGKDETIGWLKGSHRRYTNKKADMGTVAHMAIEAYLDGRDMSDDQLNEELTERGVPLEMWKATKGFIAGAMEFFDQCEPEVLYQEATVYSRKYGYAGTADIIGRMRFGGTESLPCIIDFKTGKGVYPEMGLQLSAYAKADFIGLTDGTELPLSEIGDIRHGVIVRLTATGGFEAVSFNLSDELHSVFLSVQGVAQGLETMERSKRPGF